jgi:hypothetical protein
MPTPDSEFQAIHDFDDCEILVPVSDRASIAVYLGMDDCVYVEGTHHERRGPTTITLFADAHGMQEFLVEVGLPGSAIVSVLEAVDAAIRRQLEEHERARLPEQFTRGFRGASCSDV